MAADTDLSDLQLAILGVLWRRGRATVAEVHADLATKHRLTQKTVGTLLRRLEQRGRVRKRLVGRQGEYRAVVGRRRVVMERLAHLFHVATGDLAPAFVQPRDRRAGDDARLAALLREFERRVREDDA